MDVPGQTYTAAELAAAVNDEMHTDLTARTVYFYRSKGVLSPLEMIGSQPKFTDRHRQELKAALAMQRAWDRPSLGEVARRLRSLSGSELEQLATRSWPGMVEERMQSQDLRHVAARFAEAQAPTIRAYMATPSLLSNDAGTRRTLEVAPGVTLRLATNLPDDFVAGLVECIF